MCDEIIRKDILTAAMYAMTSGRSITIATNCAAISMNTITRAQDMSAGNWAANIATYAQIAVMCAGTIARSGMTVTGKKI